MAQTTALFKPITIPATPYDPLKDLSKGYFKEVFDGFIYSTEFGIQEFMSWIVKGSGVTDPDGIEMWVHHSGYVFHWRDPQIGQHFAAKRHNHHTRQRYHLDQKIGLTTAFSVYQELLPKWKTPEAFAKWVSMEAQASQRATAELWYYIILKLFADDTYLKKNEYTKALLELYDKPSGNSDVPFSSVSRSVEEIIKSDFKIESHALDALITKLKTNLDKNAAMTYKKESNNGAGMPQAILWLKGIKNTVRDMCAEISTKYAIDATVKEPITVSKEDLICLVNTTDVEALEDEFIKIRHPEYIQINAETLGVGKLIIKPWIKKGEVRIIHKNALNVFFIKEDSVAAQYPEARVTNYSSRWGFYMGTFDCFPCITLKKAAN